MTDTPRGPVARAVQPSWAGAIGVFIVGAGWVIGLRPFADNSFLTHLATGRIILDTGSVPSTDPYTFTAHGEPWVVQSWLVSLAYGLGERVGGLDGVHLVTGLFAAILAGLGWTLLKPAGGLLPRLAAAVVFVGIGGELWAERPFMVGLICFALTALSVEGRLDPRWLVPIMWVWVNSHGSFPLGIVLIVVAAIGTRLDGERPAVELAALRWGAMGVVLVVQPLGYHVLTFPLELLQRQDLLSTVIEWQAPTFKGVSQRMFLLQVVVTIVLLARKPSYRSGLIVAVFFAAALLGARNLTVASVALLPVMAPLLTGIGSLQSDARPRITRFVGLAAVATVLMLTVARFGQAPLNARQYPIAALAYLESTEVDTRDVRLAAPDIVGNLIDYVYGPDRRTYYDDRFDMFPEEVTHAHRAFFVGNPRMRAGLDDLGIDLVVSQTVTAPVQILTTDPAWRVLFVDDGWTMLCRRDADLGGTLGTC